MKSIRQAILDAPTHEVASAIAGEAIVRGYGSRGTRVKWLRALDNWKPKNRPILVDSNGKEIK